MFRIRTVSFQNSYSSVPESGRKAFSCGDLTALCDGSGSLRLTVNRDGTARFDRAGAREGGSGDEEIHALLRCLGRASNQHVIFGSGETDADIRQGMTKMLSSALQRAELLPGFRLCEPDPVNRTGFLGGHVTHSASGQPAIFTGGRKGKLFRLTALRSGGLAHSNRILTRHRKKWQSPFWLRFSALHFLG